MPGYPAGIAANPATNRIYVTSYGEATVAVVDGATNTVVSRVNVGVGPQNLDVDSSRNKIYVANYAAGSISAINGSTSSVTGSVPLAGGAPYDIDVDAAGGRVYATDVNQNKLHMLDAATLSPLTVKTFPGTPFGIEVNEETGRVYVANRSTKAISVLDRDLNLLSTVQVPHDVYGLELNQANGRIYTSGDGLLSVIDGSTNAIIRTAAVGSQVISIAASPSNGMVYLANFDSNTISAFDATNQLVASIPTQKPYGVAVNPVTDRIYTANYFQASVSAFLHDVTPPETSISSGPASFTNSNAAALTFSGTDNVPQDAVRLECRLDSQAFAACTSPTTLTALAEGPHTFAVRAVDQAGNVDPTPATRTWTVDRKGPVLASDTAPEAVVISAGGVAGSNLTGGAIDDFSGVTEVAVSYTGLVTPRESLSATLTCSDIGKRLCEWSAQAPTLPGRYEVTVTGRDNAFNPATPLNFSITVV
ncbi:MAG TPA: YncE family protein [Actinomycetota bacterium]|nr:YncE family protein [Actinomycetota bacterium]